MRRTIVLLAAAVLAACSVPNPAAAPSASCDFERLSALEALYFAEAVVMCGGYALDSCPELEAIESHHAARVDEWVMCSPEKGAAAIADAAHAAARASAAAALRELRSR